MADKLKKLALILLSISLMAILAPSVIAQEFIFYTNEMVMEHGNILILDADDNAASASENITFQFGATLSEQFYWDIVREMFVITDDLEVSNNLYVLGDFDASGLVILGDNGQTVTIDSSSWDVSADGLISGLTGITSTGSVDFSGTDGIRLREDPNPTANSACTAIGELIFDTTDFQLQYCSAIGSPGTWVNLDTNSPNAHLQNTDTGSDSNSFIINTDGNDATLQFGQNTDGQIIYNDGLNEFDFDANRITNVLNPDSPQDAATKNYVDDLINGLSWGEPVDHVFQLVDGIQGTGGVIGEGDVEIIDETLVLENDTINITYNSGSSNFVLTAKDSPVAANCEFESGVSAISNEDMASSIMNAIDSCASASAYSGNTHIAVDDNEKIEVFHDSAGSIGNGTIVASGSGINTENIAGGVDRNDLNANETRLVLDTEAAFMWSGDTNTWTQITGGSSIPDATTDSKGKVELAEDGEASASTAVQGSDSRLHYQNNDIGSSANIFTLDADNSGGNVVLQFGATLGEQFYWDNAAGQFVFTDDITVSGNLNVSGTLNGITNVVGTSNTQILTNKTLDGDDNTFQDIDWGAIKTRAKSILLIPEFAGLHISEDGSDNIITLVTGDDAVNDHNYYKASSATGSLQDIDLVIKVQLPNDFAAWDTTPFQAFIKSTTSNTLDNQIDISIRDSVNAAVSLNGAVDLISSVADTWIQKNMTFSGTPTWTAGDFITIRVKMQTKSSNNIYIGEIKLNYIGK